MTPDKSHVAGGQEHASSRFARNSLFGTVGGLATALAGVLGSVIVAHALGVASTGRIAYALWLAMVTAAIADLGVQPTLARYLPELAAAGQERQGRALITALRNPIAVTAGVSVAGFFSFAVLQREAETSYWTLVGLAAALQVLAGMTYGRLRGIQRFDSVARLSLVSLLCQLTGIAVGAVSFGVSGALVGYCCGALIPAALAWRGGSPEIALSPELRARARRYALYAWAAALSSTVVWSRAEVFFLQRSWGSAAVGLFSVGVTLANLAAQGPTLLTAAILPHFAQGFGQAAIKDMRPAYAAATRVMAFLVFPAAFGMAAILPAALPLIYGREFAEAVPAAMVLVVAAGIGAISTVGASLVLAMDRSDFVFLSGAVAAALTLLAGLTVIPAFGLLGAAWARAAIQLSAIAFGSWFIVARLRFPMPFRELGKLLLAAGLCGVAARASLAAIPGWLSLPAAIGAGAIVYVAAVRMLYALPASDIDRLRAMSRILPRPLASAIGLLLRLLDGAAYPFGPAMLATARLRGLRDAD